jgi:hypothetical protein
MFTDIALAEYRGYTQALNDLAAFAGVRCVHGVRLERECTECEPLLDHEIAFEGGA